MNAIQCFGHEMDVLPWNGAPGADTFKGLRAYLKRNGNTSAVKYVIIVDEPDILVATRITYRGNDLSVWVITV